MKAKEYYQTYHDALLSQDEQTVDNACNELVIDLTKETQSLLNQRKAKSTHALCGVVREINDKYNAVVSLFESKDGVSPLKRDGFKAIFEKEIPSLCGRINPPTARRGPDPAPRRTWPWLESLWT